MGSDRSQPITINFTHRDMKGLVGKSLQSTTPRFCPPLDVRVRNEGGGDLAENVTKERSLTHGTVNLVNVSVKTRRLDNSVWSNLGRCGTVHHVCVFVKLQRHVIRG